MEATDRLDLVLRVVMVVILVVQALTLADIVKVMKALVVELGTTRWENEQRAKLRAKTLRELGRDPSEIQN